LADGEYQTRRLRGRLRRCDARFGTIVSAFVSDSTTPFSIGISALCICSWITVRIVRQKSPELATEHLASPLSA